MLCMLWTWGATFDLRPHTTLPTSCVFFVVQDDVDEDPEEDDDDDDDDAGAGEETYEQVTHLN